MQKFEFPLDRSLKMFRMQEEQAEILLLRAVAAVDAGQARVQQLERQLQEHTHTMHLMVGQQLPPGEWANMNLTTMLISESILLAKKELAVLEEQREQCRQTRIHFATQAEAIQTHRDEQLALYKKQLQKYEQERVDESGLRSWMANASESE